MEQGINDFIETKKKKKKIKKMIMFMLFFLLLLILFFAKAPIFNIKMVKYENNKIIDEEELYKLYNPVGKNIFFIDTKKAKSDIKKNPYVEAVAFKKQYPNKLTVKIKEKKAFYFVKENKDYFILANDLSILEVRQSIGGMNLIELKDIKVENRDVGTKIVTKTSTIESADKLAELLSRNTSNIKFDKAGVNNRSELLLYCNDVKVIIGSDDDLEKKVNRAINVLSDPKVNIKKGYINVQSSDRIVVMDEDHPVQETEDDAKQKEIYDNIVNGQGSSEEYGD